MNRLRIDGLAELKAALKELTPHLVREAAVLVQGKAEAAKAEMAATYPVRTYGAMRGRGNLQKGLTVETKTDRASTFAIVRNKARHAYIFENGTGPRRWANGKSTGSMPPGRVFIPIAMRRRREMYDALIALLRREGFQVAGDLA